MRSKLFTAIVALTAVVFLRPARAEQSYLHNIYLTARTPAIAKHGKWVFDISTPERMEDMIGELSRLGINAITYHSAYRSDGADYGPRNVKLKRSRRWPEGAEPVRTFLDICARHRIAGYLGVFLYPKMDVPLARLASNDIAEVFHGTPGMDGYVLPIEGSTERGISTEEMLELCQEVRKRGPKLRIMDYPNGPYSASIVQTIVTRAKSGLVDIENIQFHGADERLKNFFVTRGMTHLVMGMASRCRSIVHTHYKYGGGKAWLKPKDAYKIRQEAVLTATPDGTSIFSFQHGFWGAETGPVDGEALWRRLVWYEGILAVQRMVPLLQGARPLADVGVLIPAQTTEGGQTLVEKYWLPFARKRVGAQMFAYRNRLSPAARLILCPSLVSCDAQQRGELEALAKEGRSVAILSMAPINFTRYDSERTRRILGVPSPRRLEPKEFSAEWLAAIGGITENGQLRPVEKMRERSIGRGRVIRMPAEFPFVSLADGMSAAGLETRNLPDGYMAELWQTNYSAPFVQILGTRPGLSAENVSVVVPAKGEKSFAWFFDRLRVERLAVSSVNGKWLMRVPALNDEFASVLLGNTPDVTLRPSSLLIRSKVGHRVPVSCSVVNTTEEDARGEVHVSLPAGWSPARRFKYELEPAGTARFELSVKVPSDAERRPYFLVFRSGEAVQRCMIFPEDGRSQVISEQSPPPWTAGAKPKNAPVLLSSEWRTVTAGEPRDSSVRGHLPGVCFMPRSREWDAPAEYRGKKARYGETIPRVGGPNFLVNSPDTSTDIGVRLTYLALKAGRLQVYDGKKYHLVGELEKRDDWMTEEFQVLRESFRGKDADRSQYPGQNVMFEIRGGGIYVHRIEVRQAAR